MPATGHPVWRRPALVAVLYLTVAACCPDPKPADGGSGEGAVASGGGAKLSTIQKQIFDKSCVTDCHEGSNARKGLRLTAGKSFSNLVNVPSQQLPAELRVIPTDPDRSYLVRKLEGTKDIIGKRMPQRPPWLEQSQIDLVRSWITRGAPND